MSDKDEKKLPETEETKDEESLPDDVPDSGAMKALLKRSLAVPEAPAAAEPASKAGPSDADRELLLKVQKKLRQRSKGKFYGDGWSTTQSRLNYALIAAVMLVTIVAVYLALGPTGISLR
jgi:hypothetical protein